MEIIELILEFFFGVQEEIASQKSALKSNNHLTFTRQQAIAITKSVFAVANADGKVTEGERRLLDQLEKIVTISKNDEENLLNDYKNLSMDATIILLNTLTIEQKYWYGNFILDIANADKELHQKELEILNYIFPKVIPIEQAKKIYADRELMKNK